MKPAENRQISWVVFHIVRYRSGDESTIIIESLCVLDVPSLDVGEQVLRYALILTLTLGTNSQRDPPSPFVSYDTNSNSGFSISC
jgi:hypothetical protein